jgi:chitodextrinase/predicted transglutaminase-like cysteine proteinase
MALIFIFGYTGTILAQEITRGPYLQTGTPTSIIVKWRTDIPTDSQVLYGTSPDNLNLSINDSKVTTEHEVEIIGLSPDTKYYYSIGITSNALAGGDDSYFFVTSPTPGTAKPTRIWVLGDSGTKDDNARSVRDAYYNYTGNRHTDIWLMLGDNAYDNGSDQEYQLAVFENMYEKMLQKSVLWPTLGNHDDRTSSSLGPYPYYDIFTLPKNGEAGGMASGTEAYYSFDYGNIRFVCLNSQTSNLRSSSSTMWAWLNADLATNDKDWTIAFWHHPPYSKGSHNSDKDIELIEMREHALPLLEDAGVDLVLTGHSHSYERSFLIDGHYGISNTLTNNMIIDSGDGRSDGDGAYSKATLGPASHEGSVYIVAGNSGKVKSASLDHPIMFTSSQELGSLVLDIYANRLDATFIDDNGNIQDYFTIIKGSNNIGPASQLVMISGNNQTAPIESTLPNPFIIEVRDTNNQPVPGVAVTFEVTLGNGSISNIQPQFTTSNGRASANLTLGNTPGIYAVTASSPGLTGSLQTFTVTAILPDTTPPSTPTNLQATAVSSSQIDISWDASTDPSTGSGQATGVTGYRIYRDGSLLTTHNSQLTTYSDTELSSATTYTYTVSAIDAAGNESAQSNMASVTTQEFVHFSQLIEAEDMNLISPMATGIDTNASGGQYISLTSGTTSTSPVPEATLSLTVPETGTYYLWIRMMGPDSQSDALYVGIDNIWDRVYPSAENAYEWIKVETSHKSGNYNFNLTQGIHTLQIGHGEINSRADALFLTDDLNETPMTFDIGGGPFDTTPPSAPNNLQATAVSSSQIDISWNASTDPSTGSGQTTGVTGYRIYRDGSLLTTQNSQLTTYSDTELSPSTTYTYTVSAYDAAGNESSLSAQASTTTNAGGGSDTTEMVPLIDMGVNAYYGFDGGLYENGSNVAPFSHDQEGLARAAAMQPLDTNGNISDNGKIVMLSIGMSNTTQEFCSEDSFEPCDSWTFMGQAAVHPDVDHDNLVIVNGAEAGESATTWGSASDFNYDRVRDNVLSPKGLAEAQIQVVWVKQANPHPTTSLPDANADVYSLEASLADIARAVKIRYPNIKMMFVSSRIYGGYASTTLNPEPYAYESGFAVKWLIEAQINQMSNSSIDSIAGDLDYNSTAPWISWGPYLWSDGLKSRSDGLIWESSDFENDGTHPSQSGEEKVGSMLIDFFLNSSYMKGWFTTNSTPPPVDTTPPSAPNNLQATAVSSSQIDISWDASTDSSTGSGQATGVTGYRIYRDGSLLTTQNSQLTTYSDTELSPSTTYTYTVSAIDASGNESGQSDTASVTTNNLTLFFQYFEAEDMNLISPMTTGFDANASGGQYISPTSGSLSTSPVPEATISLTVPETGTYYLWVRMMGPDSGSDALYVGIDNIWDRVYPIAENAYEWIKVETSHKSGNYNFNLTQGIHTLQIGHGEINSRADALFLTDDLNETPMTFDIGGGTFDTIPPSAPNNLQATAVSSSQIDISWDASTDPSTGSGQTTGVTGYRIYRDGSLLTTHNSQLTTYSDTELSSATTYTYAASAIDAAGNESAQSNMAIVKTHEFVHFSQLFEAEYMNLISPMITGIDTNASGGQYISPASGTNSTSPVPEATLSLTVPETGTYYLWIRMMGPDSQSDALYVGIDNIWDRVYPIAENAYEWIKVETSHKSGKYNFNLTQGTHTLQIGHGEINSRADALFVTDDPNEPPVTSDTGGS